MYRAIVKWNSRDRMAVALAIALGTALATGSAIGVGSGRDTRAASLTIRHPRVVVLKSKRSLHLFDGQNLIRSYAVDLGVTPIGQKRRALDGRTPEGRFRVISKNPESPFHRFVGIDYPDRSAVDWGLTSGLISPGAATAILQDIAAGRGPNWQTALGGGIGLHGHSTGTDSTGGCIALADAHIEELFSVLRIGDPIDILP